MLADDVVATVVDRDGDLYLLDFSVDVMPFLELHGDVPLPPYLGRSAEATDVARYQTVYARTPGAVAAPTAGLHFDEAMLVETREAGIEHIPGSSCPEEEQSCDRPPDQFPRCACCLRHSPLQCFCDLS